MSPAYPLPPHNLPERPQNAASAAAATMAAQPATAGPPGSVADRDRAPERTETAERSRLAPSLEVSASPVVATAAIPPAVPAVEAEKDARGATRSAAAPASNRRTVRTRHPHASRYASPRKYDPPHAAAAWGMQAMRLGPNPYSPNGGY